jgi:hypothetical protein
VRALRSALVGPAAAYVLPGERPARDLSYERILVVVGGVLDGLPGPRITVGEAEQHRNGLVAQLRAGVTGQHPDDTRHDICHARLLGPAGLAGKRVQCGMANQIHGVAQSPGEDRCGRLVGVVIEEAQTTTAHERIRVAKRRDLNLAKRSVGCDGRPSFRRRGPEPLQEAHGSRVVVVMPVVPAWTTRRRRHVFHGLQATTTSASAHSTF